MSLPFSLYKECVWEWEREREGFGTLDIYSESVTPPKTELFPDLSLTLPTIEIQNTTLTELTFHPQSWQSSLPHRWNPYTAVLSPIDTGCPKCQLKPTFNTEQYNFITWIMEVFKRVWEKSHSIVAPTTHSLNIMLFCFDLNLTIINVTWGLHQPDHSSLKCKPEKRM